MTPIDAALSRSRTVVATLVFLLIAGMSAYINIPKESRPDIDIPIIYVSMNHTGIFSNWGSSGSRISTVNSS